MNLELLTKTVGLQLRRNKMKSFFMMLGIIISVAALVLVQTIGENIANKFHSFISETYPANTVYLAAGNGDMGGGKGSENLKLSDINAVVNSVSGIVNHDLVVNGGIQNLSSSGHNINTMVTGVSEFVGQAKNRDVVEGRMITANDVQKKHQVAMIGSTTAEELFPNESPLDQIVFYNNVSFEIIGVLESIGADPHGNDADNTFQVPHTTLLSKILKRDYYTGATFILENYDPTSLDEFVNEVSNVVRERHFISDTADNDFSLVSPKFLYELVDGVFNKFDIFIPVLSFVVFLIAGVVMVNIMLTVIKERTSEIGLRKALGARPGDIRLQIFLEMLIVCIVGALVGVILANIILTFLQPIFENKFGIPQLERSSITNLVALVAAMVCGMLSAIIPTQRAVRMNPVTALA